MLDIPCGDFFWMKTLELDVSYTGADIVGDVIEINERCYAGVRRRFVRLDLTRDDLPKADLVLCRDCLVHFSYADISRALANIRRSGSTYLLTTTFPDRTANEEIPTGSWRPINLQRPPLNFPPPLESIREGYWSEDHGRKDLSLWRIADIPRLPL
jgi:hypothetical protein